MKKIQLSVKQVEYINNAKKRWNGKIGATQSGKTYIDTLYIIPERIRERRGLAGLVFIVGVSKETIIRNVIEPLQELYGNSAVTDVGSNNICRILGQKVYCLGADNVGRVSKFRGARVKYLYIDEIVDINKEVFSILKTRLSFEYSCCDFAGNPQYPSHWCYEFINNKDIDIYLQTYTLFDNPFLPKSYVTNLCNELKGTVYYQRYILGEWVRAEGLVYPSFTNDTDCFILSSLNINPRMINIGVDFGGNRSSTTFCATGLFGEHLLTVINSRRINKVLTPEELYEEFYNFAEEIYSQFKTVMHVYCDSNESTLIAGLKKEQIKRNIFYLQIENAKKKAINERIRCTNILIGREQFKILHKNNNLPLIEALNNAVYDEKQNKDERLDKVSFTNPVDMLDAFEYTFESEIYNLINL